jgi:maleamate amidohydrolase
MNESLQSRTMRAAASASAGFGQRPALLVIDFVRAYLVKGSPLYAGGEAAPRRRGHAAGSGRAAGIPIVHTNVAYQPGGRDGGVFFRKVPALACFEAGATRTSRIRRQASSRCPASA